MGRTIGSHLPLQSPVGRAVLKTTVVGIIALGIIVFLAGLLATLELHGHTAYGINSLSGELAKMGNVNSYLMMVGGGMLFILAAMALHRRVSDEKQHDQSAR